MKTITFLPSRVRVEVEAGSSLLCAMNRAGLRTDAPCGGKGTCGKCRVEAAGKTVLACQTPVLTDMTVTLSGQTEGTIQTNGFSKAVHPDGAHEYAAAFDIGTTTLVGFLLNGRTGAVLNAVSDRNPQVCYGADVIARIESALASPEPFLQQCILGALRRLLVELSDQCGISPTRITLVSVVGNPAMHHLLLGIDPRPLITPPYMPAIRETMELPAASLLPIHPDGIIRVLPNIAGFVGADTAACLCAVDFGQLSGLTLMIDIGTNGELVLGNKDRRVACSTAAGPCFEGAKISMGMRACPGAIDHVWIDGGTLGSHTIGDVVAVGICGSGLLDLTACLLELGVLDASGYLEGGPYTIPGTAVTLTQKDVREVQLAKAAVRTGIELLCAHLVVQPEDIRTVMLAGAFGSNLEPSSVCRIGMIPSVLRDRIRFIGNAAAEGARRCAVSREAFEYSQKLAEQTEFLELASMPEFSDVFVDALQFSEEVAYDG